MPRTWYAEDLAAQALAAGFPNDSFVADAAGPDTLTFEELLRAFTLTRRVGLLLRDVVLTRDEVEGLMAGLLTSGAAPTDTTKLSSWLNKNADGLGRRYVSGLRRNYRRLSPTADWVRS